MEGGKKVSASFFGWPEDRDFMEKMHLGASYRVIQRSWFAKVNVICNLLRKKLREVAVHFRADFWVGFASRCV